MTKSIAYCLDFLALLLTVSAALRLAAPPISLKTAASETDITFDDILLDLKKDEPFARRS